MKTLFASILGLFLFISSTLAVEESLNLPAAAPVVDEFGLLSGSEERDLSQLLTRIKATSGVEISVFIPSSLRDREISQFSLAVAEQWKLGRKKEDKGLLFVIAPKEKRMRLEVGYGLEGDITDAFSGRILDNIMRPSFRAGRYYEGIVGSIAALQEKLPLGLSQEEQAAAQPVGKQIRVGGLLSLIILLLPLFFFFVIPLMILIRILQFLGILKRPSYRSYRRSSWGHSGWGGGGFGGSGRWGGGGSSWGGGGGGFGGGGASSSW